jgi:malate/lactate dehydrogenase
MVIITAGQARKLGMTRIDPMNTNVRMVKSIAKEVVK